jgi:spermidine/putrescine transport system permease protein
MSGPNHAASPAPALRPVPGGPGIDEAAVAKAVRGRRIRSRLTPYTLLFPGGIWLAIFFIVPMFAMLTLSMSPGDVVHGFVPSFNWATFHDTYIVGIQTYKTQILRSLSYGLISTVLQIAIAYPIAYWLAFRAGTRKTTYLFMLLLPFFVSFVLRTQSWQFMLRDDGIILGPLKHAHLLSQNFHVLATTTAVVGGLTYNYLPFMILPIYVALERVDPRLIEASYDLYATKISAFRKVIFPLSLPGIFAGVVITFVPVTSDFVNAEILGGTSNTMIGSIIQRKYLINQEYPIASGLAFTLMALLLVGIFSYARALGTEDVLEAAAR